MSSAKRKIRRAKIKPPPPDAVDRAEFWELKAGEQSLLALRAQLSNARNTVALLERQIADEEPKLVGLVRAFHAKYQLVMTGPGEQGRYNIDPKTGKITRFPAPDGAAPLPEVVTEDDFEEVEVDEPAAPGDPPAA